VGQGDAADIYYIQQEWYALSPEKRKSAIALRDKRGNVQKKAKQ